MSTTRIEHDLLGEREVPADRYYGVQTLRAVENFAITGITIAHYPRLIRSLAYIKKAAALTNQELGLLEPRIADAISRACDEILSGALHDEFVVDVIQGGAGTSTNMNANEVIANRALELLGYEKGRYDILHPLNHVNMSQSTNDVYPTALRLTLSEKLDGLMREMTYLRGAFARKADEFSDVIKMGRTQLQDAVPMTLGQEFGAWAIMITEDIQRVKEAQSLIREINMGATAIGTGLNSHPDYARLVTEKLRNLSGIPVVGAENLVEATQDAGAYVQLSGVLKRVATKLSKICNDLRLLSSGPRAGFNEINLPPMAPGSSIMPGKVNPIIPEVVNQVAFEVIGNDITVTLAAEAGQLELNVMEPVIAYNLFTSLDMLGRACRTLADRCVDGITANREVCRRMVENSIGLVTALNPFIGYEKSTIVADEALKTGRSVYEIVLEKGYLSKTQLDDILSPENMTRPRYLHT
jgi:aspartate ammonia-lyase